MAHEKSQVRLTAAMLKRSQGSNLAPVDRSGRAQATKQVVKTLRFTTPAK